jgi:DNA-binding transcriptional MerR regulator/mannose-6-phosphate isomerase-like protein (cupin superfamily)
VPIANKLISSRERPNAAGYLKIGEVARRLRISASLLRAWENAGLIEPTRTAKGYRLYSREDVKQLKQAVYLSRVRRMNAAALVEFLGHRRNGSRRGLATSLPPSSLGNRLRQMRTQRKLALAEVSKTVGVSVGFLSALERGQMTASVGTLRKLAAFFELNILDFFHSEDPPQAVVRPHERKVLEAGPGVRMDLLAWGNTVMEPHLFHVAPGKDSGSSYAHPGEEFLFVLNGRLEISLGEDVHQLSAGDSLYFDSSTPHTWRNPGKKETRILWINTPPTF